MSAADRAERLARTRDRVLGGARLAAGDDVLDLAAGTGLLTFGARDRIADGWVYAVDSSVPALEELLRAAHEIGVSGVMYLIGDAEVIPLPDAAVDACIARSVLVHVADLPAAAGELHRVLRSGGRLSLYEAVNHEESSLATTVDWSPLGAGLARRVAEEWEAHAAASPLVHLDDERLAEALAGAGFAEIDVELDEARECWQVDARTVDLRLDAAGPAGELSLRQRWERAFRPAEVEALAGHLHSLAGETLTFSRPQAWVTARRP